MTTIERIKCKLHLLLLGVMLIIFIQICGGPVKVNAEVVEYETMGSGYPHELFDETSDTYESLNTMFDFEENVTFYGSTSKGFDNIDYTHDKMFDGTKIRRGIDVSKWQKDIDWKKVKDSGVEFAFIKLAGRGAKEGELYEDPYGKSNLIYAKEAGIKVGVYFFSEAITVQEAEEEADYILNLIDGTFLDLPIVFDYEDGYYVEANIRKPGRFCQANISKELGTQICNAFCSRVKSKGYTAMVYANLSTLDKRLIESEINNTNYIWAARYGSTCSYKRDGSVWKPEIYNFWQYSESLSIEGIEGNSVDGDFWYDDGLSMALNRTGLFYQGKQLYYFKNGKIDYSHNGVEKCKNDWYYVKNGKVDLTYSGLASNKYGWWYIQNGKVNMNYTGLCDNELGAWYVKGGKVQFDFTGVPYVNNTSINGNTKKETKYSGYYSIVDGKLSYAENVLQNSNGWWYCKNSRVDFKANTVAYNKYGWWYIKDGKVDFNFNGIARNSAGDWYIKGGKVDFDTTSVVQSVKKVQNGVTFDGWYYVKDGKVVYNTTTIEKNNSGWWYIGKDGKVDFSKNCLASNKYGWWYIKDGKVDFNFTGIARNNNGDWYVENGKVMFDTTAIKKINSTDYNKVTFDGRYFIKDGKILYNTTTIESDGKDWWYIGEDGKVDYSINTVAQNRMGYWYVKNGKVEFDFTGIAGNANGDWYIKSGKVDFNTTGIVFSSKNVQDDKVYEGWYYVEGGKVIRGSASIRENNLGEWYIGEDGKVDFSYTGEFVYRDKTYNIKEGKVVKE